MRDINLALILIANAGLSLGFSPAATQHCVDWAEPNSASVASSFHADDTLISRLCKLRDTSKLTTKPHQPDATLGEYLGIGIVTDKGCQVASNVPAEPVEFDVAITNDTCKVWWRMVSDDVIPPIPELSVQFNDVHDAHWLGLCRAQLNGGTAWSLGVFHMSDGPLFGQCVLQTDSGELVSLIGGRFDIVHARMGDTCKHDPAVQQSLAADFMLRVDQFLLDSDRATIERISGHNFDELVENVVKLGSCILRRVLSADRYVPGELNTQGLHLLRCILCENMADARRRALGYHTHSDYASFIENGFLLKDFSKVGDNELRELLRMVSGEEYNGIPKSFSFISRNTTHSANDPQYTPHMDTFTTAIKVWIFEESMTLDHGPLHYVPGSNRNTQGKLEWMYNSTIPPASEAMLEPSLRLYSPLTPADLGFESDRPILPLHGVKRTLVIADTSGLHHRGVAVPGTIRLGTRLAGDNDGGLPRLDPWRLPNSQSNEEENSESYEGEIRMSGCNADCGRVEIMHNGLWGFLCSSNWTRTEADVVCKQLGFGKSHGAMTFGGGVGKVWLGDVRCHGNESEIQECNLSNADWGTHTCGPDDAVGVSCLASAPPTTEVTEASAEIDLASYAVFEPNEIEVHEEDKDDCVLDASIPLPFASDPTEAFVYGDKLKDDFSRMNKVVKQKLCNDPNLQRIVTNAVAKGLQFNHLGLNFGRLFSEDGVSSIPRSDMEQLRSLYLGFNQHANLHSGFDNAIRYPRCADSNINKYADPTAVSADPAPEDERCETQINLSPESDAIFRDLARDGIAIIDNFGLDIAAIKKTADWAVGLRGKESKGMTSVVSGGSVIASRLHIPEAEVILNNETINNALRKYFSGKITANGYKIVKLSATLKDGSQYIASEWHHDRVGRRLKLFVFLHDVDCVEGHPTLVANASHDTLFYKTELFPWTRFDDAYVRSQHAVTNACGRAGGGFIFDTNSVHKGTPTGANERTTVVYEYHPAAKCSFVQGSAMGIPCPSGDQFMVNKVS